MRTFYLFLFIINIFTDCLCQVNTTDVEITPLTTLDYAIGENSIFISPLNPNIIISTANTLDKVVLAPLSKKSTAVYISLDGGETWNGSLQFQPDCGGDAVCSIDDQGRMYVCYVSSASSSNVILRYSDDNGSNWSGPIIVASMSYIDKPFLYIDNRPNRTNDLMLCAFTGGGIPRPTKIVSSHDRGLTWNQSQIPSQAPIDLCSSYPGVLGVNQYGTSIAMGPEGNIYVTWAIYDVFTALQRDESAIGFSKSKLMGQM